MNPESFVQILSQTEPGKGLFNHFRDICPIHDLPNAEKIRTENLKRFLDAKTKIRPRYLWVAEAPGYNGSRRSGVFLVSEKHFKEVQTMIGSDPFTIATKTEPKISRTVQIMWRVMKELPEFPLTFDALPFHPFQEEDPMSNRTPSRSEIVKHLHFLKTLLYWLNPENVIAIGRKAEFALAELKVPYQYVRHPAQGGEKEFVEGIKKIYGRS